jgi:hypothetical protein
LIAALRADCRLGLRKRDAPQRFFAIEQMESPPRHSKNAERTKARLHSRHRPENSTRELAQVYGSNQIELSWTVIPILIVVMLFLSTTRIILGTEAIPKPPNALDNW